MISRHQTQPPARLRATRELRPAAPWATYRLQFNREFTFRQATEILHFLDRLGISHLYASPLYRAGADSTHGYDVCAFGEINPVLGTASDFEALNAELRNRQLGLLVDIVPNHMGNHLTNSWWRDVLENGPASPFARCFDIQWHPPQTSLQNRVLVPVLERHYAETLAAGELRLTATEGELGLAFYDKTFPVSKAGYELVLASLPPELRLAFLSRAAEAGLADLKAEVRRAVAGNSAFSMAWNHAVESFNGVPGQPRSFDHLHALIGRQHYRLAFWRIGPEEINYRRFFDVTELVSLRMEDPLVFAAAHEHLFGLIAEGVVSGLRIDHPDGLYNPGEYLQRLQKAYARVQPAADHPLYVVVEKILTGDEPLRTDWPVAGTTGYEFLNQVNGLFVEPRNESALTSLYERFIDGPANLDYTTRESKRLILERSLISELDGLIRRFQSVAQATREGLDCSWSESKRALLEVIACFPAYRTYTGPYTRTVPEPEHAWIRKAAALARRHNPDVDEPTVALLERLLLLDWPEDLDSTGQEHAREFVLRFQQVTGPVMAKGLEDTTFYRYNRLISLNEVGGDPGRFGRSPDSFHAANQHRRHQWPHTLLATATHDTKRGEDTRARINVLSELPAEWGKVLTQSAQWNARWKTAVHGRPAPDPKDEYLLLQTLAGAWPEAGPASAEFPAFRARVQAYMLKAIREAKSHTTWTQPHQAYEDAVHQFIERTLEPAQNREFLDFFSRFQARVAFFGRLNSLSQTLLKLTSPGVPDIYQGTELWDLSLVDPDNRRSVDYSLRRQSLECLDHPWAPAEWDQALRRDGSGEAKLHLLSRVMRFRANQPDLFAAGEYEPLFACGRAARHLLAFRRHQGGSQCVVIASRLLCTLTEGACALPSAAHWHDTTLNLPQGIEWQDLLTARILVHPESQGSWRVSDILSTLPLAFLTPHNLS